LAHDSRLTQSLGLVGWLALAFVAAAVGGAAAADAPAFYGQLVLPTWAPPAGAFGPVWTVLYTLMGIAAWLVWRERRVRPVAPALALFAVQLAVNAAWSWFFFAWKSGAAAFVAIVLLLGLIVATMVAFYKVRRAAGLLFVPYLAWVCLATALSWTVWRHNPTLL
jgi:tryptophan-rich sensory protein